MVLAGPGFHSKLVVTGRTISAPPRHHLEITGIALR
jgi:hypothetical protein